MHNISIKKEKKLLLLFQIHIDSEFKSHKWELDQSHFAPFVCKYNLFSLYLFFCTLATSTYVQVQY